MSAIHVQLQFLKTKEQCEIEHLFGEITKIGASATAVRKGMYARLNEIKKRQDELDERLKVIEENLCKK